MRMMLGSLGTVMMLATTAFGQYGYHQSYSRGYPRKYGGPADYGNGYRTGGHSSYGDYGYEKANYYDGLKGPPGKYVD